MDEEATRHWAEQIAEDAIQTFGNDQVVASGWSPSGVYHIGNFREAITCRALHKELVHRGANARFILNIDDIDPLDKVPGFLRDHQRELRDYIGHPINQVPDPYGTHESYAAHFTADASSMMDRFDVHPELVLTSELYKQGNYNEFLQIFLDRRQEVSDIMERISGNPLVNFVSIQCEACGNIAAPVAKFDESTSLTHVEYECVRGPNRGCGHNGVADLTKTTWKLKWRLDWPARQSFLGVTVEPAGKDHSMAGGSIDTATAIHKDILNREPPIMPRFGFINLHGKKMSGSSGLGMAVSKFAEIAPPEALLFKTYRIPLLREYDLDPRTSDMIEMVRDLDAAETIYYAPEKKNTAQEMIAKAFELAAIGELPSKMPVQVDYNDLMMTLQGSNFNQDQALSRLVERKVLPPLDQLSTFEINRLRARFSAIEHWIKEFAPDSLKFTLQDEPNMELLSAESDARTYLELLKSIVTSPDHNTTGDNIQQALFNVTREHGLEPKLMFRITYLLLLGKERGPKAGPLLYSLGIDRAVDMIDMALAQLA